VFAKCALSARRGIATLLRREDPSVFKPCSNMATDTSPPTATTVKVLTVGETLFAALRVRGEKATQRFRDALITGWAGWEQWHLSSKQVDDLFAGKCDEAEEVRAARRLRHRFFCRCTRLSTDGPDRVLLHSPPSKAGPSQAEMCHCRLPTFCSASAGRRTKEICFSCSLCDGRRDRSPPRGTTLF